MGGFELDETLARVSGLASAGSLCDSLEDPSVLFSVRIDPKETENGTEVEKLCGQQYLASVHG